MGKNSGDLEKNRNSLIGMGDLFSMSLSTSKPSQNQRERVLKKSGCGFHEQQQLIPYRSPCHRMGNTSPSPLLMGTFKRMHQRLPFTELTEFNELREQWQCQGIHHNAFQIQWRPPNSGQITFCPCHRHTKKPKYT